MDSRFEARKVFAMRTNPLNVVFFQSLRLPFLALFAPSQKRRRQCRGAYRGFQSAEVICLESRALLAAPTVTQSLATIVANSTTLTIAGTNFDTTAKNNSVLITDTVTLASITVTPTTATATSLAVSLTGIGTLTGGDKLTAVVTTNSVSSGSAVQVATIAPIVTLNKTTLTSATFTIAGFGFNPTKSHDILSLTNNGNPIAATITAATANTLTVKVTGTFNSGTLSAAVNVNGVSSGAAVQVGSLQPIVTSSVSPISINASSIVINGFGYDPNHAQNTVVFNDGAVGIVTSWSTNSLTIKFLVKPTSTGALTIVVTSRHVSSGAPVQVATVV